MSRASGWTALWLALLIAASGAHGDEPRPEAAADFRVRTRIGNASVPFASAAASRAESRAGQTRAVEAGLEVRLASDWRLELSVPWVSVGVEQPAGSYRAGSAWGNPMLEVVGARPIASGVDWKLHATVRGGAGIPLACTGSADDHCGPALALADGLSGWARPEQYARGAVPVLVAGGVGIARGRWLADASVRAPLLIRIDSAGDGAGATHALGFLPTFEAGLAARVIRSLRAGAVARVVRASPALEQPAGDVHGRFQISLEPRVAIGIGAHLTVGVDAVFALGGPLSGSAALGLHLAARLQ